MIDVECDKQTLRIHAKNKGAQFFWGRPEPLGLTSEW
jgi:hypothetical protein